MGSASLQPAFQLASMGSASHQPPFQLASMGSASHQLLFNWLAWGLLANSLGPHPKHPTGRCHCSWACSSFFLCSLHLLATSLFPSLFLSWLKFSLLQGQPMSSLQFALLEGPASSASQPPGLLRGSTIAARHHLSFFATDHLRGFAFAAGLTVVLEGHSVLPTAL